MDESGIDGMNGLAQSYFQTIRTLKLELRN